MKNIEKVIELKCKEATTLLNQLPWSDKKYYGNVMAQIYYYVQYSTRLLAYAGVKTPFEQNDFFDRLTDHIGEESHHEMLALNDLKNLGFNLSDFPELNETKEIYESPYAKVFLKGSYTIMGWVLGLEFLAVTTGKVLYNMLKETYNENQLSFLKVHVLEDEHHTKDALKILDVFTEEEINEIAQIVDQSIDAYLNMIKSCVKQEELVD
ncbi:iron-containing redox enzyme family protein [Flammeovirga sp. OC4]|uniref:iron-containing redox enzyme family protein n=1 Tax=Flammeovirga sp. OC4 TaxID=1382345 RepID=UPI0005C56787|nr:iron-containing redox enzyme family protein [Flammeovirga sp. OC4]